MLLHFATAQRQVRQAMPSRAWDGFRKSWLIGAVCLLQATTPVALAGTWTPLVRTAPAGVNLMLQLSDGTVMAARNNGSTIGKAWYRLTPDSQGSYVNGTWTTLASAHDTRLYYPSQVLKDGRVFVAGGEYGTGGPNAEVYDPLTNVWTQVNPPASLWNPANDTFYDCNSEILPDGRVLLMPVGPHTSGTPLIYDPTTNAWSNAGHLFRGTYQDEASWVKLPDDSILTIDPFGTNSERYIPSSNTWVNDGVVPVSLYDPYGFELGAGLLLADGRAFFLGSTGHTAFYTPTGTTSPGAWVAGPDIPGTHGTPDAPAAMLVTGNVLCAVSPVPTNSNHFPTPTTFYEYDPVANSFISEPAPVGSSDNIGSYEAAMLVLPDGNVLYSHFASRLYVYQSTGTPLAAGKPAISGISMNSDGSYHLTGTKLNGISEGAAYGDDLQMNSNYPLVRLTSGSNVFYARTFNWSRTSVQTGSAPVSTEFAVPPTLNGAQYTLVVVANGYSSDPISFAACTMAIQPIADDNASCGAAYTSPAPSLSYGTSPITWTLGPGAPAGMTNDSASGVVSWPNPSASGSPYTITTKAANVCSNASQSWTLTVGTNAPSITAADDTATCGVPYASAAPTATGGALPLTWSLVSGPSGMTVNSATGAVSWANPVDSGSPYAVTIQADGAGSCGGGSTSWALTVLPNPPVIDTIPNAFAVCGATYTSVTPSNSGGPALTWSLIAGPLGMTIDPSTGIVSWRSATALGSPYTVTVQVTTACGTSAPQSWQLGVIIGDFNADGLVTVDDIQGFSDDLLADPPSQICAGDLNGDGNIDGLDVPFFDAALGILP